MTMPFLISLAHAGLDLPPEATPYCRLTLNEIIDDGDQQAADIYSPLQQHVAAFHTTNIARAILDMNRSQTDRSKDGVVKTHTCWNVPVYHQPLTTETIDLLLRNYYHPYHQRLTELANTGPLLGIDCHTMAAVAPPVAPDAGQERPWVCLSNNNHQTCPRKTIDSLARCFANEFANNVTINNPFLGGHIVRTHSHELPWIQLEISRGPFLTPAEKQVRVHRALSTWANTHHR